jgi:aryl-alcohol dehydrogenase-like predicted oxidoreductase
MRIRSLGRTGIEVSELCLGSLTFGPGVALMRGISAPEPVARAILDRAVERGITLLDSADVYQEGESERILGRWMRQRGNRQRLVLATKVGGATGPGPADRGLSREHILRACEASLERLDTDHIDLYQVHWPDTRVDQEQTLEALAELQRAGKIRHAGCSNFPAWYLARALWIADGRGLPRYETLQPQYSLAVRHIEREVLPLCRDQELAVLPWGPLANGLLGGRYGAPGDLPAHHQRLELWRRRWAPGDQRPLWELVRLVTELARRRGCAPATLALAWVMGRPGVCSTIIGARTVEQLEQNLAACELRLSDEELALLDRASAPPPDYPTSNMRRLMAGGGFWD